MRIFKTPHTSNSIYHQFQRKQLYNDYMQVLRQRMAKAYGFVEKANFVTFYASGRITPIADFHRPSFLVCHPSPWFDGKDKWTGGLYLKAGWHGLPIARKKVSVCALLLIHF